MAGEYVRVLKNKSNVDIVGVIGRDLIKLKDFSIRHEIPFFGNDVYDAIKCVRPDGIIVAINIENVHNELKKIIDFNIPILVEKPPGINLGEYRKIFSLSNAKKSIIFVGLNRRYYQHLIDIRNFFVESRYKYYLEITDQQQIDGATIENYNNQVVVNWPYANSIHQVDLINFFAKGMVKLINKSIVNMNLELDQKIYFITLEDENENIIKFRSFWNLPSSWSLKIVNQDKFIECEPMEIIRTERNFKATNGLISEGEDKSQYKKGLEGLVDDFLRALLGESNSLVTLAAAEKTMSLIAEIYD
jgi:predicted dehydrogenase